MADQAPKNSAPILVTLFIGAIVLVTAVVAVPSVSECISQGNFGACMRQGLEQRGILPGGASPEAVETIAKTTAEETAPTSAAEPTSATEPKMDAAQSADLKPKSALGLVRAEPDGSVVIAGSGTPGEEIEVFANGVLLGTVKIEKTGDWVLVPDAPLPTGGVEITVGSVEKANQAAQSVIVVIQDDRTSEPLVVASTPGAASQILQGKTASNAVAEPSTDAKTSVGEAPQMDVASLPKEQVTPAAEPKVETQPQSQTQQPEAAVVAAPAEATPSEAAPVEAAAKVADEAATKVAEAQPAKPVSPPSIDAIEVDGGRNFFAGGGEEGANVRLYVNDQFVADSVVSGGRWLIETDDNVLTDPSQRVRIDMLETGSSVVSARAEVNFEISVPATVVAEAAPAAATPTEVTQVADAPEMKTPAEANQSATTTATPEVKAAAPAIISDGVAQINAAAADNAAAQLASPPSMPKSAATAAVEPKPATRSAAAAPQPQTKVAAPADKTAMAAPETAAKAAEIADTPAIPTLRAAQVGDASDQRYASGSAIIRRGDNLWSIAKRVYGSGYRYTAIYDANQDQIRNPDLIYPGQVFDLP